jgi:hypothetical protein
VLLHPQHHLHRCAPNLHATGTHASDMRSIMFAVGIYERELTYLYVKKHKNMIILSTNDSVHTRTYWNSWML